jgi:hypothetical protein
MRSPTIRRQQPVRRPVIYNTARSKNQMPGCGHARGVVALRIVAKPRGPANEIGRRNRLRNEMAIALRFVNPSNE